MIHPSLSYTFAKKHDLLLFANTMMKDLLCDHDLSTVPHPIQQFLDEIQIPLCLDDDPYTYCTVKRLVLKGSGLGIYSAFLAHQAAYLGCFELFNGT